MTRRRVAAGTLGATMVAAAVVATVPGAAQAQSAQASAACSLTLGTVTVQGDHKFQTITATSPVTAGTPVVRPKGLFPVDQVRLATSLGWEPDPPSATLRRGYVTIGTDLYRFSYAIDTSSGQLDPASYQKSKVGGGWIHQTFLDQSTFYTPSGSRTNTYALQDDVITRWTVEGSAWRSKQSTLLLGIDKDTRTAYLYAVGHANGAATVIKGLGTVGNQFVAPEDKTYFRYFAGSSEADDLLYGE